MTMTYSNRGKINKGMSFLWDGQTAAADVEHEYFTAVMAHLDRFQQTEDRFIHLSISLHHSNPSTSCLPAVITQQSANTHTYTHTHTLTNKHKHTYNFFHYITISFVWVFVWKSLGFCLFVTMTCCLTVCMCVCVWVCLCLCLCV